jgi:ferredoxin
MVKGHCFEITIHGTAEQFWCHADQVILKAMLALGCKGIPSGCHGGGCGVCKVRILSGEYRTGAMSRDHVSAEDERAGIALACQIFPRSDITVQVLGKMRKALTSRRRYGFV